MNWISQKPMSMRRAFLVVIQKSNQIGLKSPFLYMDFFFHYSKPAAALVVALLLSFFFSRRRLGSAKRKAVPEVAGGWPVVGHLFMLGGSKPPHIALGSLADKYGPIFRIRIGVQTAVVVSNSAMVKECFSLYDAALFARPQSLATKNLTYDHAFFAFSNDPLYWRELRKITTLELLSNRRIEQHKHVRVTEIDTWITELHDTWAAGKAKSSPAKVPIDLKEQFKELTFNAILKILVGKRYFGSRMEGDQEEARRFSRAQEKLLLYLGMFTVSDAFPCLSMFDFGGHQKKMKNTAEEMDVILEGWLEEHKLRRDVGLTESNKNVMDIMISTFDNRSLSGYDADTVIKATILLMIVGSTNSMTAVLIWATSLLLNNPRSLKKARVELDDVIGRERVVIDSDISKLVYLDAVIKESIRLYPPGPLATARELIEDCVIGGYHIRKGTRLIPNTWKIQTDPEVWPEPMEFRPERLLTTHEDVDEKGGHPELIPFGCGRRMCPGINLAFQMLPLSLARLLQAFEIETPLNKPVDMSESFAFDNTKTTPLDVLIAPRLSANLF